MSAMAVHCPLTTHHPHGPTLGLKVAVSIPDEIFAEAEDLAKRFNTSRSELYSRALGTFIDLHAPERLTQAMNEAVDALDGETESFNAQAARQGLRRVEW